MWTGDINQRFREICLLIKSESRRQTDIPVATQHVVLLRQTQVLGSRSVKLASHTPQFNAKTFTDWDKIF